MLELADRRDLGSRAARREGSNPSFPISVINKKGKNLKYEKFFLEDHQVKLEVEFDQKSAAVFEQKAAVKISNRHKIPGFRPGKAPLEVIKRIYGDALIREEAIELLVNDHYPKLLEEAGIKAAGPGKLESIKDEDSLKITFIVPLQAEVVLGDYKTIKHPYNPEIVSEVEIQEVLEQLRYRYSTATEVEREATNGDLVSVQINASLENPAKDEESVILNTTPLQVIIGKSDEKEEPFPFTGFDHHLLGMKTSGSKDIAHSYSKDSVYENLRGKKVLFHVSIESVKELILPELNEEFAKSMGDFNNLDELKEAIRKDLEKSKKSIYDREYYSQLLEKIISCSTIKYSPQMLSEEQEKTLSNFEQDLAQQSLDLDTYIKINKLEKEKFIQDEIVPAAKRQLEESLVIEEIRQKEKIELKEEELEKAYTQTLFEMQATTDIKKLMRRHSKKKVTDAILMRAASRVLNGQVLLRLKEIANEESEKLKDEKSSEEKKE